MADRTPVSVRLTKALKEAGEQMPRSTPEEIDAFYARQSQVAREFLGGHVRTYMDALANACIRTNHRGSVPPRDGRAGIPCLRCQGKISQYRSVAELIEPDRPE